MAVDKPKAPKLDVDKYLTTALSSTPQELHPFFEAFSNLYSRRWVYEFWKLFMFYYEEGAAFDTRGTVIADCIRSSLTREAIFS